MSSPTAPRPGPLDQLRIRTCGHFVRISGHHVQRESPGNYLLMWVIAGLGFAASQGRRADCVPGDLVTLLPRHAHEYGADPRDPWTILWVHMEGPAAELFIRRIGPGLRRELGLDPRLRARFLEMIAAHRSGAAADATLGNCLLWGVLGLMVHRLEVRAQRRAPDRLEDIQRVQGWIDEHLHQPITVDDLADRAGLSRRQLARLFAQVLRMSPMQYVLQQRVAHAAVLLVETGLPVRAVSRRVGCDDPYYFSRLFKQATGQSPRAYRQARTNR